MAPQEQGTSITNQRNGKRFESNLLCHYTHRELAIGLLPPVGKCAFRRFLFCFCILFNQALYRCSTFKNVGG